MITPINLSQGFSAAPSVPFIANSPGPVSLNHLPTPPQDASPFRTPAQPRLPDWNSPMNSNEVITIKTKYNPQLKENAKVSYPREVFSRFVFTEEQRKLASLATPTTDIQDFTTKVGALLMCFELFSLNHFDHSFKLSCVQVSKQTQVLIHASQQIF